jgi:hypothetical protein
LKKPNPALSPERETPDQLTEWLYGPAKEYHTPILPTKDSFMSRGDCTCAQCRHYRSQTRLPVLFAVLFVTFVCLITYALVRTLG